LARRTEILDAMSRIREQGYISVLFAIIDILKERTTILISGNASSVAEAFNTTLDDEYTITIPGILSRKKNIVPLLPDLVQHITAVNR
ncbi:MAG: DHHA2 domain-containing protein, partial [Chloroflexia bacterium]